MRERYRQLAPLESPSRQLDHVFSAALLAGATTVYIDRPYVDFDYRSDRSHFYSRGFRPPPQECERLLFADDVDIVGASVMRPLPQQVGRTMVPPPRSLAPYVTCKAPMDVHAFGESWRIEGYPFVSQDGEYGRCVHAALWSIARYHHLRFGADRHTISGIIESAGLRERADRTIRSAGLYAFEIVGALRGVGLPSLQYPVSDIPESGSESETLHTLVERYLNSGIPVAVLTSNHIFVLVGYGDTEAGRFYVASDDNFGPYILSGLVEGDESGAWNMLIIPLPGRIHVTGEGAEARAEQAFEDRVRAKTGPNDLLKPFLEEGITSQTYATPSSQYLCDLEGRSVPDYLRNHHIYVPKSNWLWVTEFSDESCGEGQILGELAVDATSLHLDPSPLFGNIDGWAYLWPPNSEEPKVVKPKEKARYRSALAREPFGEWAGPAAYPPYDKAHDEPVD